MSERQQETAGPIRSHDTATDLKAVVEARRELGPEMEDHLLAAFLGRIEQQVDARVREQVARTSGSRPVAKGGAAAGAAIAVPSFALAIPLVAIAGGIAGTAGIVAVMVAVVLVNLMYLADRWR